MKRSNILLLLLMLSVSAVAQDVHTHHDHSSCDNDSLDPMKEAILSEVTVTGLTGVQRLKDSPIPFSVISPKKLNQSIGSNIVDVISRQPGVSQISTGAGISKPVIRGLGYNRVVVVEQGIRQEGQQWGDEHGLEVDAEGVHSVEILKGPASLMYGSDAIAGVMILHPEPSLEMNTLQVKVGGEYQSNNGLYDYHVGFAGNLGGWLWNWHYSDKAAHCYRNAVDGYIPGSWYKERDIQGMFGLNRTWGHSWIRFSHVDFTPGITEGERDEDSGDLEWEDFNSPKSYATQLPFQRVLHTKVVFDNVFYIGSGTLKAILGFQQNYRREFEEAFDEAELAMRLNTLNYDVRLQQPLCNEWSIATGINGMWQQNLNHAEEMLIPDYRLFDFGFFATASKHVGRWNFSGGARIDSRHLSSTEFIEDDELHFPELSKDFSGFTGSLGAVYNVNDNLNARINVARGFRAPTVSELASNGVHEGSIQYELGNADLKSEFSTQLDFGLDYTSSVVSLNASLFSNWISNYIFLGRLPFETEGYRTYQYRQGDARLIGGEISLDVHPVNPLHIENSFSYVRGIQLNQPEESKNLPMIPAPRWTCSIRYELPDFAYARFRRSFIALGMDYSLRQDNYYALDDTETSTPDYAVFDFSLGTDLHVLGHNCIELTLSCQNLFDKVYQSHLSRLKYADVNIRTGRQGISAMGRNICVKVNIPIDIHL